MSFRVVAALAWLGAVACRAPAAPPVARPAPVDDATAVPPQWAVPVLSALEARLGAQVASDDVGSLAATVVIGDRIVWQAFFGTTDRGTGALPAPATLYRAGSLGKPVLALTLLALVDRGVIGLDDPVAPYLPELQRMDGRLPEHDDITFRHLAAHTAGLAREPESAGAARGDARHWRRRLVAAIPGTAATHPPGQAYLYSNVGYALLALALERAAGRPFDLLARDLLLEPLAMTRSGFGVPHRRVGRLTTGYVNAMAEDLDPTVAEAANPTLAASASPGVADASPSRQPLHPAHHRGDGYRLPSVGLYSTSADLARLIMAMTGALGDSPVPAHLRALALTDQTPARDSRGHDGGGASAPGAPAARAGYGLGFQLHRLGGTLIAGHSGTVPGYTAYLAFDPDTRVGVVLLRSYDRGATNLGAAAARTVLDLARAAPDPEG